MSYSAQAIVSLSSFQSRKVQLPQSLEQHYVGRIGEVERPQPGIRAHRDSYRPLLIGFDEVTRQACGLAPEENHVLITELRFGIELIPFCSGKPHPAALIFLKELVKALVHFEFYIRPVIQPRPSQALLIKAESQWLHKVQHAVGSSC